MKKHQVENIKSDHERLAIYWRRRCLYAEGILKSDTLLSRSLAKTDYFRFIDEEGELK